MNKKVLFLILLGVLVLTGHPVFAQLFTYGNEISYTDILDTIKTNIWVLFAAISLVCFVIAGVLFLTAGGAPEKLKAARSAAIWGVVGVAIGIVAYSIITIVGNLILPSGA